MSSLTKDYQETTFRYDFLYKHHDKPLSVISTLEDGMSWSGRKAFLMRMAISAVTEGYNVLYFGFNTCDEHLQHSFYSYWRNKSNYFKIPKLAGNIFFRNYTNSLNFHDLKIIIIDLKKQLNTHINLIVIENMDVINFERKIEVPEIILEIGRQETIQEEINRNVRNNRAVIINGVGVKMNSANSPFIHMAFYENKISLGVFANKNQLKIVGGIRDVNLNIWSLTPESFQPVSAYFYNLKFEPANRRYSLLSRISEYFNVSSSYINNLKLESVLEVRVFNSLKKQLRSPNIDEIPIETIFIDTETNKMYLPEIY